MKKLLLPLLLLVVLSAFAQKEGNIWYFGNKAGVDFNTGVPLRLNNSVMNTGHGCASISDKCSGELLFYTDGTTIWDSTHNVMPNGTGLLGDKLSTQSAIIVPHPDTNRNSFFVFTVQASGSGGIHFSEVNMNANAGRGDVVSASKNTPLVTPTVEKLTAVKHRNNVDVWVITHELNTNSFYAYLITPAGISLNPVVSSVGAVYGNDEIKGYMKVSPDGRFLATALRNLNTFDVFSFDFNNGIVSNQKRLGLTYPGAYGVEFSPDGSKLYGTINSNGLYQFDLEAGDANAIDNSAVLISNIPNVALQLGPDGKIYTNEGRFLGVINNPNRLGTACNYADNVVSLGSSVFGNSGLPTFLQSYFNPISIVASNICFGQETRFSISNLQDIDSMRWNFGDPTSGLENTSKLFTPVHNFANPGTYSVELIYHGKLCNKVVSDTISKDVEIINVPPPSVNLGPDTSICPGTELLLNASGTATSYLWSDQSLGNSLKVTSPGLYWVEVENSCGFDQDSIEVSFFESKINLNLGKDTSFCFGNTLTLDVTQNDVDYLWSDGNTSGVFSINTEGQYWVTVSDRCTSITDSLRVSLLLPPVVELPPDTILCTGDVLLLNVNTPGANYNWQDGSANSFFEVIEEGTYYVKVSNKCGNKRVITDVAYQDCSCQVFIPNAFSPNGDNLNAELSIYYDCELYEFSLKIFSRWGELVYETTNPDASWDGRLENKNLPTGVYIYEIQYKGKNNQDVKGVRRRGKITLIK